VHGICSWLGDPQFPGQCTCTSWEDDTDTVSSDLGLGFSVFCRCNMHPCTHAVTSSHLWSPLVTSSPMHHPARSTDI